MNNRAFTSPKLLLALVLAVLIMEGPLAVMTGVESKADELFSNTLYLSCGAGVNDTWAVVIAWPATDFGLRSIKQTSDGGYILVGAVDVAGSVGADPTELLGDILIVKLGADGLRQWSGVYKSFLDGVRHNAAQSVCETFDANGVSNGYIVVGVSTNFSWNWWLRQDLFIMRFDTAGNIRWQKREDTIILITNDAGVIRPGYYLPNYNVCQTFAARGGAPSGYVITGPQAIWATATGGWVWKIVEEPDLSDIKDTGMSHANGTWIASFTMKYGSSTCYPFGAFSINQVFDAAGNDDGYILTGESTLDQYTNTAADRYAMFVMKIGPAPVTNAGAGHRNTTNPPQWLRIYTPPGGSADTYFVRYADRVYNPLTNAPDGYLVGGYYQTAFTPPANYTHFLRRMNNGATPTTPPAKRWFSSAATENNTQLLSYGPGFPLWRYSSGSLGLGAARNLANGDPPRVVNIDAAGVVGTTLIFPVSTLPNGWHVQNARDGGYIVTGYGIYHGGDNAIYIYKTGPMGNCYNAAAPTLVPVDPTVTKLSFDNFRKDGISDDEGCDLYPRIATDAECAQ